MDVLDDGVGVMMVLDVKGYMEDVLLIAATFATCTAQQHARDEENCNGLEE